MTTDTRNKGEQQELLLEYSCKVLYLCRSYNNCILLLLLLLLLLRTLRIKVVILVVSKTQNFSQVLLGLLLSLIITRKFFLFFLIT